MSINSVYEQYFGLEEHPFSITPDPRFIYLSESHRAALEHLKQGAVGGANGFVLLTGDVGTGKTTICRTFLEHVPPKTEVALILNPVLTLNEFLQTICEELDLTISGNRDSNKNLIDHLNRFLLQVYAVGQKTILIVDEAQNLSHELLEQIRLLTNLETNTDKLLQIFLIGQPELREMLDRPDLLQVSQRITSRYHLGPLNKEETRAYILRRLEVAGTQSIEFTGSAIRRIYAYTKGVPRLINVLCDKALLSAYERSTDKISDRIIKDAEDRVRGNLEPARRGSFSLAAGIGAVGLLTAALLGASYSLNVANMRPWVDSQLAALFGGGTAEMAPDTTSLAQSEITRPPHADAARIADRMAPPVPDIDPRPTAGDIVSTTPTPATAQAAVTLPDPEATPRDNLELASPPSQADSAGSTSAPEAIASAPSDAGEGSDALRSNDNQGPSTTHNGPEAVTATPQAEIVRRIIADQSSSDTTAAGVLPDSVAVELPQTGIPASSQPAARATQADSTIAAPGVGAMQIDREQIAQTPLPADAAAALSPSAQGIEGTSPQDGGAAASTDPGPAAAIPAAADDLSDAAESELLAQIERMESVRDAARSELAAGTGTAGSDGAADGRDLDMAQSPSTPTRPAQAAAAPTDSGPRFTIAEPVAASSRATSPIAAGDEVPAADIDPVARVENETDADQREQLAKIEAAVPASPASVDSAAAAQPGKTGQQSTGASRPRGGRSVQTLTGYTQKFAERKLLSMWGVEAEPPAGVGFCRFAQRNGLNCLTEERGLPFLYVYNRPAMISMKVGDLYSYAVVIKASPDNIVVDVLGREHSIPADVLPSVWDGRALILWRGSDAFAGELVQGDRGRKVGALRQLIDKIEGKSTSGNVYDAELVARVKRFQSASGLKPDGIFGPRTHMVMQNKLAELNRK